MKVELGEIDNITTHELWRSWWGFDFELWSFVAVMLCISFLALGRYW